MAEDEQTPEETRPGGAAAGEAKAVQDETRAVLSAGPGSGNRSGALAFLALLLIIAAILHYSLADRGGYAARLDSELISHAELSVAAMRDESRLAVVPAWPLDLYETLRRDIAVYAAMAAAAAYVWSAAARARARRDAFLVYEKLNAELADVRLRLEKAERSASLSESQREMKG
jgi:hypothetical protein